MALTSASGIVLPRCKERGAFLYLLGQCVCNVVMLLTSGNGYDLHISAQPRSKFLSPHNYVSTINSTFFTYVGFAVWTIYVSYRLRPLRTCLDAGVVCASIYRLLRAV